MWIWICGLCCSWMGIHMDVKVGIYFWRYTWGAYKSLGEKVVVMVERTETTKTWDWHVQPRFLGFISSSDKYVLTYQVRVHCNQLWNNPKLAFLKAFCWFFMRQLAILNLRILLIWYAKYSGFVETTNEFMLPLAQRNIDFYTKYSRAILFCNVWKASTRKYVEISSKQLA